MSTLRQDLRSALRLARRKPGVAAVVVLSVALGIGACTTMFCLVWVLVLRPLPFAAPEGIQAVLSVSPAQPASNLFRLSYADYADVRAQSRTLTDVAALFDNFGWTLAGGPGGVGSGGAPERVNAVLVSARLLPLLGAAPILGRQIREEEARRETAALGRRLAALHPEDAGRRLEVSPFRRAAIDDDLRQSGLAVLTAVLAVLLISCANITDLLLAQAIERRREIAMRAALGATPRRIVRQLLTESLLFALAGGALGLPLGAAGVHFLRTPLFLDATMDEVRSATLQTERLSSGGLALFGAAALFFAALGTTDPVSYAGVTILLLDVAFIACWLPARRALEIDPAEALREE
jgi:hypothetical protein